jgi:hypothetical protein
MVENRPEFPRLAEYKFGSSVAGFEELDGMVIVFAFESEGHEFESREGIRFFCISCYCNDRKIKVLPHPPQFYRWL